MEAAPPGPAEPATRQERIDFLKQIIAASEGHVRTYDTKAQISLAAFVISANPIVAIATSSCSPGGFKMAMMLMVPAYIGTILAYLWVLWPVTEGLERLIDGIRAQNIYYIADPARTGSREFIDRLGRLSVEPELTAEALKLAHIRKVKSRRFRLALVLTMLTLMLVAVGLLLVGRCL